MGAYSTRRGRPSLAPDDINEDLPNNRRHIYLIIKNFGPISKRGVAKRAQINKEHVDSNIERLTRDGYITQRTCECGNSHLLEVRRD